MGPGGIQKGNYNPQNLTQDQRNWLWGQFGHSGQAPVGYGGENTSSSTSQASTSSYDPMALAGSLQQMQIKANQPAIQTLQSRGTALSDQYQSLLNSVLQQGTAAQNYFTGAASSGLAARGILPGTQPGGDVLYNQSMGSALLPITAQNQAAIAQVGMGSTQDLNQLAAQIASLQAGNVQGAITGAPALAGLQTLPAQIGLLGSQAYQAGAAGRFIPIPGVGIYDVSGGSLVGGYSQNNLSTGGFQILNTTP